MTGKIYGYCRLNDNDQDGAIQIRTIQEAGVDKKNIAFDQQNGKEFDTFQYEILKNDLCRGDLLIVNSLDALGKNCVEISREWQCITKEIKADIKVLNMNLLDTTLRKDVFGTYATDLFLQILAYTVQKEKEKIKIRQAKGIATAKAHGKRLGRPKAVIPENFDLVCKRWKAGEITAKQAMEDLHLKRTTFYKLTHIYLRLDDRINGLIEQNN